jgi:hypothetical protein
VATEAHFTAKALGMRSELRHLYLAPVPVDVTVGLAGALGFRWFKNLPGAREEGAGLDAREEGAGLDAREEGADMMKPAGRVDWGFEVTCGYLRLPAPLFSVERGYKGRCSGGFDPRGWPGSGGRGVEAARTRPPRPGQRHGRPPRCRPSRLLLFSTGALDHLHARPRPRRRRHGAGAHLRAPLCPHRRQPGQPARRHLCRPGACSSRPYRVDPYLLDFALILV